MLSSLSVLSSRRRFLLLVVALAAFFILSHLLVLNKNLPIPDTIKNIQIPSWPGKSSEETLESAGLSEHYVPYDNHPISLQLVEADKRWQAYEDARSLTFRDTLSKYRRKYGRHPPPGFEKWYKFARDKGVHNIDDFEQVMDDLRPFWGVEPAVIRALAARMWEVKEDGISSIHIRDHKIARIMNTEGASGWRVTTMAELIKTIIEFLPDMDIAMNNLDQPRVAVPWYELQTLLTKESESRQMGPEVENSFTKNLTGLQDVEATELSEEPRENPEWFSAPGKQYMDIARKACPPKSHANDGISAVQAQKTYKRIDAGGIVTNYNLSTDLCTVGPEVQDKHGLLYSASTIVNTHRLVPVFGECKVNINNDILFPANMYWRHDERYEYDGTHDLPWDNKTGMVVWRGVTSGGVQLSDNWKRMHRQRLVQMLNATEQADKEVRIMTEQPEEKGSYENFRSYRPAELLRRVSDVGFTEMYGCFPDNCDFYFDIFAKKNAMTLGEQFKVKYLVDVDGHSFSGRWRAFLQSRALGIKATIFREWHDSRLVAWRHFVPLDNRYDDIYTILTYFTGIGNGNPSERRPDEPYVERHDVEGKRLALQGREWAQKVLRNEDLQVSILVITDPTNNDANLLVLGLHVQTPPGVRSHHRRQPRQNRILWRWE